MTVLLLLSCAEPVDTAAPGPELLDDALLVRRLSLDLRGTWPTRDELQMSPDDAQEVFLADPRFEDRVVVLLAERWHTLVDTYNGDWYDFGLQREQEYAFQRSVGEEPLRLAAHIAAHDLPWSELTTADYTLADPMLETIWPLERDAGEGWQKARYTDGRPPAGVLATNGLWWRYPTSLFNDNRQRVAAISRVLLCQDYLARPVSFEGVPSLLDDGGTDLAIREEPACVTCHSSIEPVAAALFGFWPVDEYSALEASIYHPEREALGEEQLGVEMAWFGQPIDGLQGLGVAVSQDPRLTSCAAQTFTEALLRVEGTDFEPHRQAFVESGLRVKDLVRSITDSDAYRSAERRLVPLDAYGTAVEELTGYRWVEDGFDQLRNDEVGVRVLGGGVDGRELLVAQRGPSLTWTEVTRRVAAGAADGVQDPDLDALSWRVLGHEAPEGVPGLEALLRDIDAVTY